MKIILKSIALLVGVLMLPTTAYAQDIYGDVNGDLEVNIGDVNAVIDVILSDVNNPDADVNGDGEVNIADVNAIIDIILGDDDSGVFTVNIPMVNHMYNTVTNQVIGVTNTRNKLVLDTIRHTARLELVYNDGSDHTVTYKNLTAHASRTGFFVLSSPSDPNFSGYVDFNEVSFRYIYMTDDLRIISTTPDVFFLKTENTIEYDDTTETTRMEDVIYQFNLNADERTATVMVMGIIHAKDMRYLMRVVAANVPFTLTPNGYSFTGENIATTTWYRSADNPALKTTSEYPFVTLDVNVDLIGDQIVANYMLGPHATVTATGKTYPDFSPTSDDHEWVDLGLPSGTLWATCNIGATTPEGYGDFFAWGETVPKDSYEWSNYKWGDYSVQGGFSKYVTSTEYGTIDYKTELEPEDDAASVNWGSAWRMPSREQLSELASECSWEWTSINGVDGLMATGPNGNTLFMPLYSIWTSVEYWSRSLSINYAIEGHTLNLYGGDYANVDMFESTREKGFSVRAVRVSQN